MYYFKLNTVTGAFEIWMKQIKGPAKKQTQSFLSQPAAVAFCKGKNAGKTPVLNRNRKYSKPIRQGRAIPQLDIPVEEAA